MSSVPNYHNRLSSCLLVTAITLLLCASGALAQQAGTSPVKIFVLAGQSNMQGHGEILPASTMGTLAYIVDNDPTGEYQFLVDDIGGWAVWDDVWIHYERSASDMLTGSLTSGYGAANSRIGPELGFGYVMGDYFDNQVLIVKAAWGGKSLAVDFRPPSSGGNVGFYYNEILRLVDDAVTRLTTYFPDYDGQGYEIAGFGWHQGWNDRVNQTYNDEYEFNMGNFIRDIRVDLGVEELPFVIATTGMSGWEETHPRALSLMEAQLAVAQYPEFQGNVFTVETRPFWRPADESPSSQAYHWNRNAETLLEIGLAMGEAMNDISHRHCPSKLHPAGGAGGVTLTWQNGDDVPASVRILRDTQEIASAAAANPPTYTDTTAQPGLIEYELIFTMPGDACGSLTTTYDACITGLASARGANGVDLTWTNNLAYAGIEIMRDGEVVEGALSGSAEAYTDQTASSGLLTYVVAPANGSCEPTATVTYNACLTDLAAAWSEAGVVLTWTNNLAYDGIQIMRDDEVVEPSLAGTAETYTDADHPLQGLVSYTVVPTSGTCEPATVDIEVQIAAQTQAVTFNSVGSTSPLEYLTGWEFSIAEPITVTYLGHVDMLNDGIERSADVGLWSVSTGGLLDSVTVLPTSVSVASGTGSTLYEPITPLTLSPGNYIVAAQSNGENFYFDTPPTMAAGVTWVAGKVAPIRPLPDSTAAFHVTRNDTGSYFGANFVFNNDTQGPSFVRGDANADGTIDITDGIFILNFLFVGSDDPTCQDAADADDSDEIDISDGVYVLSFLFVGGSNPPAPWPDCGFDPADDDAVTCETPHPDCGL